MRDGETVYVGIDAGWSADPDPRTSGVCTIVGDEVVDTGLLGSDWELVSYAEDMDADVVGVDIPLLVPNEEGRRPVEAELQQRGYPAYPANQSYFEDVFGGVRGHLLRERFEWAGYGFVERPGDYEKALIEVYPNPTMKALLGELPDYKNVNKIEMVEGLRELAAATREAIDDVALNGYVDLRFSMDGLPKRELKGIGDRIDAFYCAYVLKMADEGHDSVEVIGDLDGGYILTALEDEESDQSSLGEWGRDQ